MNHQAADASGGSGSSTSIDVQMSGLRLRGYRREIDARLYTPGLTRDEGMVVYLHEGGFTGGDLDAAHATARAASATLRRRVLTVAYSLAPAEPFPAAVEDALCALAWCSRRSDKVSVAGVEAGGNLAAAAALASRDRRAPALWAQLLITPMLDPTLSSASMRGTPLAERRSARCCSACYRSYLPAVGDRMHPYAAPANATRLARLAPALIVTAEDDPLRSEAEQYAIRLEQAGVRTRLLRAASLARIADPADPAWLWREFADFLDVPAGIAACDGTEPAAPRT
jgi:acetyl esterase/lipase